MSMIWELLLTVLAAFGLVCLAWLAFGRLVLPVGQGGVRTVALVRASGAAEGLEQTVSGLLWLRRTGLWRGTVVIHDQGLSPEGLAAAMALAVRDGVELDRSGPLDRRAGWTNDERKRGADDGGRDTGQPHRGDGDGHPLPQ